MTLLERDHSGGGIAAAISVQKDVALLEGVRNLDLDNSGAGFFAADHLREVYAVSAGCDHDGLVGPAFHQNLVRDGDKLSGRDFDGIHDCSVEREVELDEIGQFDHGAVKEGQDQFVGIAPVVPREHPDAVNILATRKTPLDGSTVRIVPGDVPIVTLDRNLGCDPISGTGLYRFAVVTEDRFSIDRPIIITVLGKDSDRDESLSVNTVLAIRDDDCLPVLE